MSLSRVNGDYSYTKLPYRHDAGEGDAVEWRAELVLDVGEYVVDITSRAKERPMSSDLAWTRDSLDRNLDLLFRCLDHSG